MILATNIAETSLTVPGVDTVVDTGLHKVARYDATRASTRWTRSACRRPAPSSGPDAPPASGRGAPAGCGTPATGSVRTASRTSRASIWPGRCSTWRRGTDPDAFAWFEAPPAKAVAAARRLLQRLGALDGSALTPLGRRMQALPLPPRLARILIEGRRPRCPARACAILSERQLAPARREATTCDLLGSLDAWASLPPRTRSRARSRTSPRGSRPPRRGPAFSEADLRRALFVGYADRLARRREAQGCWCWRPARAPSSAARAASATASSWSRWTSRRRPAGDPNALVRVASRVEPEWIVPTAIAVEHAFDHRSGRVRAWRRERFDGLVLAEHAQAPASRCRGGPRAGVARLPARPTQRELAPAGPSAELEIDLPALVRQAAQGMVSISDIDLAAHALRAVARDLGPGADKLDLPSGRRTSLIYLHESTVRRRRSCRSSSAWPRRRASGRPALRSCCRCWP